MAVKGARLAVLCSVSNSVHASLIFTMAASGALALSTLPLPTMVVVVVGTPDTTKIDLETMAPQA